MMRSDKRSVIAASFVLLSIGSAAYLTVVTVNYLNYYPALGQIYLRADSVSIVPGSNESMIDSRVSVWNPTDYAGFRLGDVIVALYFHVNDTNATIFGEVHLVQTENVGVQLDPHSTVSRDLTMQLNPENASSFASFISSYAGRVVATVILTVQIITFLNTVTGRDYYTATQDLPLGIQLA